jgi:hypothetical protein
MAGISYAQVVTGHTFDPRLMLLDPMLAEVAEGNEDELGCDQDPLSQTIASQTRKCEIDPIKSHQGEKLLEGSYQNFAGFLIKDSSREINVDETAVEAEIARLRSRMPIGYFVGRKPSALEFEAWLVNINAELGGGRVNFSHYEGRGFFSLEADCEKTKTHLLTSTPHRNLRGMCVLQPWVPGFSPDKPQVLYVPTWITLRKLPREYLNSAEQIAEQIGKLIGSDPDNPNRREPRFCIGLNPKEGWESEVVINRKSGEKIPVLIDYDNLPIRCRFCWSTHHQVKNCE